MHIQTFKVIICCKIIFYLEVLTFFLVLLFCLLNKIISLRIQEKLFLIQGMIQQESLMVFITSALDKLQRPLSQLSHPVTFLKSYRLWEGSQLC